MLNEMPTLIGLLGQTTGTSHHFAGIDGLISLSQTYPQKDIPMCNPFPTKELQN